MALRTNHAEMRAKEAEIKANFASCSLSDTSLERRQQSASDGPPARVPVAPHHARLARDRFHSVVEVAGESASRRSGLSRDARIECGRRQREEEES